ncbi:Imm10 family immunity protein [Micromonospora chokoriensis]|uniref:Imm10 family immunity protein n=1 Tax=Micromonospora chokoriensis TaxID=356851 RepID=UPI0004C2DB24|nr:Imm10 family immunity protein [Micromonospora chokoriensis]
MNTLIANEVGLEAEQHLLMVGFGESDHEAGRDLIFQCDLRNNDYPPRSNWPQGETYCVVDSVGRTRFGGVKEATFHGHQLRLVFDEETVAALQLPGAEWNVTVADLRVDIAEIRRQLSRILTCGRPEFRPQVLDIED